MAFERIHLPEIGMVRVLAYSEEVEIRDTNPHTVTFDRPLERFALAIYNGLDQDVTATFTSGYRTVNVPFTSPSSETIAPGSTFELQRLVPVSQLVFTLQCSVAATSGSVKIELVSLEG